MKKTSYWISVAIIGVILGFSLQLVQAAWTEPTAAPPGGSTAGAPINTGAVAQNKVGSLGTSGSFSAVGAVSGSQLCIGLDCRASWPGGQWLTSGSNVYYNAGNVGIGTANPGQKLTVTGIIETTSGGVKFPDGNIQTKAGMTLGMAMPSSSGGFTCGGAQLYPTGGFVVHNSKLMFVYVSSAGNVFSPSGDTVCAAAAYYDGTTFNDCGQYACFSSTN